MALQILLQEKKATILQQSAQILEQQTTIDDLKSSVDVKRMIINNLEENKVVLEARIKALEKLEGMRDEHKCGCEENDY